MFRFDVGHPVARFSFPDSVTMERVLAPTGLAALARVPSTFGLKTRIAGVEVRARTEPPLELWIMLLADHTDAAPVEAALEAAGLGAFNSHPIRP